MGKSFDANLARILIYQTVAGMNPIRSRFHLFPLASPEGKPHLSHIAQMLFCGIFKIADTIMSRISIDVTPDEHQKLKAMAALQGKSIKDYVIERTLGAVGDPEQKLALKELESLLDERIRGAKNGEVSRRTVGAIFKDVSQEPKRK